MVRQFIHSFLQVFSITPGASISNVEYLMVAGGGGGMWHLWWWRWWCYLSKWCHTSSFSKTMYCWCWWSWCVLQEIKAGKPAGTPGNDSTFNSLTALKWWWRWSLLVVVVMVVQVVVQELVTPVHKELDLVHHILVLLMQPLHTDTPLLVDGDILVQMEYIHLVHILLLVVVEQLVEVALLV